MTIRLNGETKTIGDGVTIAELLASLALKSKYVAVERNRELIPRGRHAEIVLEDGDELEIVTLTGGG